MGRFWRALGCKDRAIILRMLDPIGTPDPDRVYLDYVESCRRQGIESMGRERALALIKEWGDALSGRPEPTTHQRILVNPIKV